MKERKIEELLEFGILNIDKPSGPTSFDVSDFVRGKLGLNKTSHFGTLDPKVTGVLPIALGRACKLTGFFLGEDKEYVGIMRVHKEISMEKIKKIISDKFLGKIKQIPPVKSRVKRQEREREIKGFELIEKEGKDFLFRVCCEGGTYIRKLIDDLGKEMDVGAHMLELRRVRAGIFKEDDEIYMCKNLYEIEKAIEEHEEGNEKELKKIVFPAEEAVKKAYPIVHVKNSEKKRLYTGKAIYLKDLRREIDLKKFPHNSFVGVFADDENESFIGMYKVSLEKDVFAKPEFVMQPFKN